VILVKLKICEVKRKEFKECAQIIFEEFNKQGDKFTKKTALQRIKGHYQKGLFFCAKADNKIAGLILASKGYYAEGPYIWVNEFVVKEEFQGCGIGKKLMQKIEREAKKKKIKWIYLNTKMLNIKFYKKLGFKDTGYVCVEKKL